MCATVCVRWLGILAARWMNMALYRACNSSFLHNPTMAHHRFCCLFVGPTSYLGKRSDVVFLMWQLLLINQPFTTILFYINSRWLFQYKEGKLWKYNFTLGLYFLGTEHCLQKTLQGMRYCIVQRSWAKCYFFMFCFSVGLSCPILFETRNRQLSKETNWNCIFSHFVAFHKNTNSNFFSWI